MSETVTSHLLSRSGTPGGGRRPRSDLFETVTRQDLDERVACCSTGAFCTVLGASGGQRPGVTGCESRTSGAAFAGGVATCGLLSRGGLLLLSRRRLFWGRPLVRNTQAYRTAPSECVHMARDPQHYYARLHSWMVLHARFHLPI